jgi:hypothetical protein
MAVEREYRATVSAVLSRASAQASLTEWVQMTLRAKAQVDSILSAPSKVTSGGKSPAKKEADERISEAERARKELERIREKENNAILKDVERITKAEEKAHERAQRHVAGIKERYFQEEQRRGERAAAERDARNRRLVSSSFGNLAGAARGAGRIAGEVAQGLGVSFDLSSAMRRGEDVDTTARKATISGKGAIGQNATEADVQDTISAIHAAGAASKQGYGALAKGLEDFVSKSSDLETGKKVLADLGKIARATGTDVNELVSAAGDVNKTLDDTPDKGEKLLDIMTLVAAQSAKGSVEVKDFARYMGRVTAGAFKFEGSKGENIGILAGLAQVAMKGGASSAREATNAAQSFSQDITKGKALSRFEEAKIDIFTDESKTKLRSPEKIITDFLRKSKGDLSQLSNLFQNEGSRRVVTGFAQAYTAAGGGEEGIRAVQAEFKKFAETMSAQDVKQRFDTSAGGREAKALDFQNKLDLIADSLATRVLPAFEEMAPAALKVSKFLADMVNSAVQNPGLAIVAAITASIAKAAIGEVVKTSLVGALSKMGAGGLQLGVLTLLATTAYLIAKEYEEKSEGSGKDIKKTIEEDAPALLAKAQKQLTETGTIDKDTVNDLARRRSELEGVRGADDSYLGKNVLGYAQIWAAKAMGDSDMLAEQEGKLQYATQNKGKVEDLAGKLDALLKAYVDSKPKGPLDVNIVGGMPTPGPSADPSGRVAN